MWSELAGSDETKFRLSSAWRRHVEESELTMGPRKAVEPLKNVSRSRNWGVHRGEMAVKSDQSSPGGSQSANISTAFVVNRNAALLNVNGSTCPYIHALGEGVGSILINASKPTARG